MAHHILGHGWDCDGSGHFTMPIRMVEGGFRMSTNGLDEYWVPEHVKDYLRKLGFVLPLDDMEPWIRSWDDWMSARGEFYDYRDKDGMWACVRCSPSIYSPCHARVQGVGLSSPQRGGQGGMRGPEGDRLDQLVLLFHQLHEHGAGHRGEGVRARHGRLGVVDSPGQAEGSYPALRRSHGHPPELG